MKGAILWLERLVLNAENKHSGTRETGWYVLAVATPLLFLLIKGWEEKDRNALFAENITYSTEPGIILLILYIAIMGTAYCAVVRTEALKYLDSTFVTIVMPFSAIITGIISILMGTDVLTLPFGIGAIIVVIAVILSGL